MTTSKFSLFLILTLTLSGCTLLTDASQTSDNTSEPWADIRGSVLSALQTQYGDSLNICPDKPEDYNPATVPCTLQYDPVCGVNEARELQQYANSCNACVPADALGFVPVSYCEP